MDRVRVIGAVGDVQVKEHSVEFKSSKARACPPWTERKSSSDRNCPKRETTKTTREINLPGRTLTLSGRLSTAQSRDKAEQISLAS